jgi:hypothetical protein
VGDETIRLQVRCDPSKLTVSGGTPGRCEPILEAYDPLKVLSGLRSRGGIVAEPYVEALGRGFDDRCRLEASSHGALKVVDGDLPQQLEILDSHFDLGSGGTVREKVVLEVFNGLGTEGSLEDHRLSFDRNP